MTVAERRQALLEWFYADEERSGWGTVEIASQARFRGTASDERTGSLIYAVPFWTSPWIDRHSAFRDLKALERDGHITRGQTGGKATWWYA
jgi:hypothetical protein